MCNKRDGDLDFDVDPLKESEIPPECLRFDHDHRAFDFLILGIIGHICGFYYFFYLLPFGHLSPWTVVFGIAYGYLTAGVGTTVGAHRYWTHRTFKANKAMRILMMIQQTACLQYSIFHWCRNHRVHHKYTDTDADPHNSKRGFWFSHIGWLWLPTHPDVKKAWKTIDMSDLVRDPIVRFQSKYYWELLVVVLFLLPIPFFAFLFPEMTFSQHIIGSFARYVFGAHLTFLVNSYAHIWGTRPYDKYISSTDTKLVSFLSIGEGWHNYHHTFPWDYKAAELGGTLFNFSTAYINFFARIGWVWDMKTVSQKLLQDRINRTGDVSHPLHRHHEKTLEGIERDGSEKNDDDVNTARACWGWGDKTINKHDMEVTKILYRKTG